MLIEKKSKVMTNGLSSFGPERKDPTKIEAKAGPKYLVKYEIP